MFVISCAHHRHALRRRRARAKVTRARAIITNLTIISSIRRITLARGGCACARSRKPAAGQKDPGWKISYELAQKSSLLSDSVYESSVKAGDHAESHINLMLSAKFNEFEFEIGI